MRGINNVACDVVCASVGARYPDVRYQSFLAIGQICFSNEVVRRTDIRISHTKRAHTCVCVDSVLMMTDLGLVTGCGAAALMKLCEIV